MCAAMEVRTPTRKRAWPCWAVSVRGTTSAESLGVGSAAASVRMIGAGAAAASARFCSWPATATMLAATAVKPKGSAIWACGRLMEGRYQPRLASLARSVPHAPLELLERTCRGEPVDADSVRSFVRSWLAHGVTDAQMAAWCAIAHARGLDRVSTEGLTSALIASGERLDLSSLGSTGDLHSTGG